jgi:hypothetical protein
MIVTSLGTGGTLAHFDSSVRGLLMPGQALDPTNDRSAFVPSQLSGTMGLDSRIKIIAVLMVGKIVFTDGSIYDGEQTYKALQDYFQELEPRAKP